MERFVDPTPARPRMRGRLHQIAFIAWIPLGITLVALGRSGSVRAATAVYAVCLIALYGVSATYHLVTWTPRARAVMRRVDHSTIFLLIAGSYTPITVIVLDGTWRTALLATVWSVTLAGMLLALAKPGRVRGLSMAMYIGLGWVAVAALPLFVSKLGPGGIALLLGGGISYTLGAVVYARRRPDPSPRVFGYHEVFHALVIAGSICHYALIMSLAVR